MMRSHPLAALSFAALLLAACGDDGRAPPDGSMSDSGPADAAGDAADAGPDDAGGEDAGPIPCDPGSTLEQTCVTSADCNDGCFCNGVELCRAGACVAGFDPCDDDVDCTTDSCDEESESCDNAADDSLCDDGAFCNGEETCNADFGCVPGTEPSCADGDACTLDLCDDTEGCSNPIRDVDGDGFGDEVCGGEDCNDGPLGADINPGRAEICDNGVDDDCDVLVDYEDDECVPSNDVCDAAELISSTGTVTRSTGGLADDYDLGCAADGADAVFRTVLTEPSDLTATVRGAGAGTAVAIRAMDDCAAAADIRCDSAETPTVQARSLEAGQYAIIVKTATPGTFDLELEAAPAAGVPAFDVCADDTEDISGGGRFTGSFDDVLDDYQFSENCDGQSGSGSFNDAVYRLQLDSAKDVRITVEVFDDDGDQKRVYAQLIAGTDCTATPMYCNDSSVDTLELEYLPLEAGTYYLIVEANVLSANDGRWVVDAEVTDPVPPADGDVCETAQPLDSGPVTLPLSSFERFVSGTGCGGDTELYRDSFYSLSLTETSDVTIDTDVGATHFVSVSPMTCGDPSAEIACWAGVPTATNRLRRLEAGDYYVTVSTLSSTGDVSVEATVETASAPPDNDVCADATVVPPGTVGAGDLVGYSDSMDSCGDSGSVEAFYTFTLSAQRNVTLVASRTDDSARPLSLSLFDGDCTAGLGELACREDSNAVLNRTLDAGTYYFTVASDPRFAGPYSYRLLTTDP